MSTVKCVVYAFGVTAVSAVMLTVARGVPTKEQAIDGCLSMFVVSFLVLKFWVGKKGA
ncbi:MAG: hypothetical protein ABSA74_01740 [Candidatus Staskawiczbacteria bacterium]|jgi:hypothetical protein